MSQYFQDSASHTAKTRNMVSQVDRFDTIFVTSEFEALVLENSLIKRHMPRYNILLKDDKGYPFVRLSKEAYPRFSLVNKMANDSARYFGPFGGRFETRQALDAVCVALRLPTCSRKFPRDIGAERPCLNFHMGRCDGFCRPEMTAEAYNRRIEQAVQLLEGRSKQLLRDMTAEMEAEAEALHFEQAALLRDRINAIGALSKKQTVIAGLCADTDIWGLYRGSGKSCYAILHMEEGNLAGRETELFSAPNEESEAEMLSALTAQYYLPRAILPHEILLPMETEDCEELSEVLTKRAGHKVWVHVPAGREGGAAGHGPAERPGGDRASHHRGGADCLHPGAAGEDAESAGAPKRMESFDISNTGKSDIVASMVVYSGTRPLKSAYRRFRIQSLEGHPDDYASMQEVLRRRLQRAADGDEKFLPLPDVFLIDGGETHARAAQTVAWEFGVDVPIFGMVKDDRHRTRPGDAGGPGDRHRHPAGGVLPHRPDPGGDPPLCHHLPPREPQQKRHPLRPGRYPRCGREAAGGAAETLRHHQGHPGGGCGDPCRRGAPGRRPGGVGTFSPEKRERLKASGTAAGFFAGDEEKDAAISFDKQSVRKGLVFS